jgi:hypothetical protein
MYKVLNLILSTAKRKLIIIIMREFLIDQVNNKTNETGYGWALVAYACNPSYSGGIDQED